MTARCPYCRHANPVTAKFCNECGSPQHLKPCAACGAINPREAQACYLCDVAFLGDGVSAAAPEIAGDGNASTATASPEIALFASEVAPAAPAPAVEPSPEPAPTTVPEPQPAHVPEPLPEPTPEPYPQPEPEPFPQPTPEPFPQPEPEPFPQPQPETIPGTQPEPTWDPQMRPRSDRVPVPEPAGDRLWFTFDAVALDVRPGEIRDGRGLSARAPGPAVRPVERLRVDDDPEREPALAGGDAPLYVRAAARLPDAPFATGRPRTEPSFDASAWPGPATPGHRDRLSAVDADDRRADRGAGALHQQAFERWQRQRRAVALRTFALGVVGTLGVLGVIAVSSGWNPAGFVPEALRMTAASAARAPAAVVAPAPGADTAASAGSNAVPAPAAQAPAAPKAESPSVAPATAPGPSAAPASASAAGAGGGEGSAGPTASPAAPAAAAEATPVPVPAETASGAPAAPASSPSAARPRGRAETAAGYARSPADRESAGVTRGAGASAVPDEPAVSEEARLRAREATERRIRAYLDAR